MVSGSILLLPLLLAGAPEITELKHDAATGKTRIAWSNIPADHSVAVFRSSRALDRNGLFFAEKHYFDAGKNEGEIIVRGSGKFHYRISAINSGRRRVGDLSAERELEETDRTAPPPPEVRLKRTGDKIVFTVKNPAGSDAAKILLLGGSQADGPMKTVAVFPAKKSEIEVPASFAENYAAVTVADSSGNRAPETRRFFCGRKMDLNIASEPRISRNRDIRLENRYFITGKPGRITFTVRNNGGAQGSAEAVVSITEKGRARRELCRRKLPDLAPGAEAQIQLEYTPSVPGVALLELDFSSPEDADNRDNRLSLELHSTSRPVYFLWYGGNVMDLEYANCAAVAPSDLPEFVRRGCRGLVITSRTKAGSGDHYWKTISRSGYEGMQLDEIGGDLKSEEFLPAVFDLKKKHPETFAALWHIGPYIRPAVRSSLRERKFDLIICELYYTDVSDDKREAELRSLRSKVEHIVKNGDAENVIIGLATKKLYRGWDSSPLRQAEFLEQQIKVVRETAPMMPGIAFFSSDNDPVFLQKVDELCKKYYLETNPIKEEKK